MDTAKEILLKSIRYSVQAYIDLCISETEGAFPLPNIHPADAAPEDAAAVEQAWTAAHSARESATRDACERLCRLTDCAAECQAAYNECIKTQSQLQCSMLRSICINSCDGDQTIPKKP